jgi:WD40 repeat protein
MKRWYPPLALILLMTLACSVFTPGGTPLSTSTESRTPGQVAGELPTSTTRPTATRRPTATSTATRTPSPTVPQPSPTSTITPTQVLPTDTITPTAITPSPTIGTPEPPLTLTLTPTITPTVMLPITLTAAPVVTEVVVMAEGSVNQVAFSPDESVLGMATSTGIYLYQATTLDLLRIMDRGARILSLDFTPDGVLLAAGGLDASIQWWTLSNGQFRSTFRGHLLGVVDLTFNPAGDRLVSASDDGTVRLWDISSPPAIGVSSDRLIRTLEMSLNRITSVALRQDKNLLAAGSNRIVYIWDVTTGENLETLTTYASWVNDLAFSPDGGTLVTADSDGRLQFWGTTRWERVQVLLVGPNARLLSLAYHPEGRLLACGDGWGDIHIWDVATRTLVTTLSRHSGAITSLVYDGSGDVLVSSSADGRVFIWDFGNRGSPPNGDGE